MKNKLQLPYKFKKIGWTLFIISFISIFIITINITKTDLVKPLILLTKYGILLGLLTASMSKDRIEDEFIKNIRMQSYMVAFLVGVIQTLVTPFISFGISNLMSSSNTSFEPTNDFSVLWILLVCQLIVFNVLKWRADD